MPGNSLREIQKMFKNKYAAVVAVIEEKSKKDKKETVAKDSEE